MKKSTPLEVIPEREIDGNKLYQASRSIADENPEERKVAPHFYGMQNPQPFHNIQSSKII